MKEFKEMLTKACNIWNVNDQLKFFLENIHICPEFISANNKIRFTIISAEIIRGKVHISVDRHDGKENCTIILEECKKRTLSGIWLEFKKFPKKKLKF